MPEPVSIVAASLGIICSAYTLCKSSSDLVSGVKNAPSHISRVSTDLHNFYPILRALETAFRGIKPDSHGLIEDMCTAVHRSVQSCIYIFRDLTLLVNQYRSIEPINDHGTARYEDGHGKVTVGKWSAIKWHFRKDEIDALTANLTQCKETCQLAVSSAHFIINQSESKKMYESLQKNNENLAKNYNLLKKLLKQVVKNDQSIRRDSIVVSEPCASIHPSEVHGNNVSDRLSQFLTDVDSVLSSSPASTPRMSMASRNFPPDEDFLSLRNSLYDMQNLPSLGLRTAFSPDESSVSHVESEYSSEASIEDSSNAPQAEVIPVSLTSTEACFRRCLETGFQEKVNHALRSAYSAPSQILHLRLLARQFPHLAHNLIIDCGQEDCLGIIRAGPHWTLEFLAVALGLVEEAKKLWKGDFLFEGLDSPYCIGIFQLATLCQDYDLVVWFLERSVPVDRRQWARCTPLQNAIIRDDVKMIEILLNAGADLSEEDIFCNKAEDLVRIYKKPQILHTLFCYTYPCIRIKEKGNDKFSHPTLLHRAVWHSDIAGIKWLLEHGCSSLAARDDAGRTSLHLAVSNVDKHGIPISQLLLGNWEDPNQQNHYGMTPLHIAAMLNDKEIYHLLCAAIHDANVPDRNRIRHSIEKTRGAPLALFDTYTRYNRLEKGSISITPGRFF